jgi:hypothetical protein
MNTCSVLLGVLGPGMGDGAGLPPSSAIRRVRRDAPSSRRPSPGAPARGAGGKPSHAGPPAIPQTSGLPGALRTAAPTPPDRDRVFARRERRFDGPASARFSEAQIAIFL